MGSEVYNRSMKLWLQEIAITIYIMQNKGKSVADEIFVRNICYITSTSKHNYINKLDDIENKQNNIYYRTMKKKNPSDA